MKKNLIVRTILVAIIMAFLLVGCGKAEAESEEVPEVTQQEVKEPEVEKEEAELQEEKQKEEEPEVKEKETEAKEEVANEQGETYNGMPVAQVETTVSDFYAFLDYAQTMNEPSLLIYNESEGYVIKMGEGEYYQIKKGDRIFESDTERAVSMSDTLEAGEGVSPRAYIFEMTPDYSKYDSPHKVMYVVYFTEKQIEGDYFLLTCYLDAPAE